MPDKPKTIPSIPVTEAEYTAYIAWVAAHLGMTAEEVIRRGLVAHAGAFNAMVAAATQQ